VQKLGRRDSSQQEATAALRLLFDQESERVFYSRQLEVLHEAKWFHWITNRALRDLVARDEISYEVRPLDTGGSIHLMWNSKYRYYKRKADQLVKLVEAYSEPDIGGALGLHGESLVLEGFAKKEFILKGREARKYQDVVWERTEHDLDFIFERDEIAYGVEVKNTLGYMDYEEFVIKIALCEEIGIRPVFVARMLPKSWVKEVIDAGGFALILKYQLYPWSFRGLAERVRGELGLPVDTPRALAEGTMNRFTNWHERQVV
jgi:hypothetical protein